MWWCSFRCTSCNACKAGVVQGLCMVTLISRGCCVQLQFYKCVYSSSAEFSSRCSYCPSPFGCPSRSGYEPALGIHLTERTPLFLIVGGEVRWERGHLRATWAALGVKVLIGFVVRLANVVLGLLMGSAPGESAAGV